MAANYQILLVEDEEINAIIAKKQLESYGYEVATVNSGEEAIELVLEKKTTFDIILMDMDLGEGMDGTETSKKILSFVNLPIIFYSSHTEPEIVEKTEKITSYGYVVKNSGITILDAAIKMAIKLFTAKREHQIIEEKVKYHEEKYRKLFECINEEVHLWEIVRDADGEIKTWRLVDANPSALKAWKKTRDETIGRTTENIWPEANPVELFIPIVKKIFTEHRPFTWESYFEGTNQTLLMTSVAFGEYFFSIGIDISNFKQREEKLKQEILEKDYIIKGFHNLN